MTETMSKDDIRRLASLIAVRINQGWDSQVQRLMDEARRRGADMGELNRAVDEALAARGC